MLGHVGWSLDDALSWRHVWYDFSKETYNQDDIFVPIFIIFLRCSEFYCSSLEVYHQQKRGKMCLRLGQIFCTSVFFFFYIIGIYLFSPVYVLLLLYYYIKRTKNRHCYTDIKYDHCHTCANTAWCFPRDGMDKDVL